MDKTMCILINIRSKVEKKVLHVNPWMGIPTFGNLKQYFEPCLEALALGVLLKGDSSE